MAKEIKLKASYEKYARLRDAKEMNDYQVSKKTGITTAYLTNWKMGRNYPKTDKLMILGKEFNVPTDFFMEEVAE